MASMAVTFVANNPMYFSYESMSMRIVTIFNNALVMFVKMVCKGEPRGMAKLVDATDLGSVGWKHLCGFESHYPYTKNHNQ